MASKTIKPPIESLLIEKRINNIKKLIIVWSKRPQVKIARGGIAKHKVFTVLLDFDKKRI